MPFSRWFRGGAPRLRDRVVKALQQARDGNADGAIATIAERLSEALAELRGLPEPVDGGWLRPAASLACRAGDTAAPAEFAAPAGGADAGAGARTSRGRAPA